MALPETIEATTTYKRTMRQEEASQNSAAPGKNFSKARLGELGPSGNQALAKGDRATLVLCGHHRHRHALDQFTQAGQFGCVLRFQFHRACRSRGYVVSGAQAGRKPAVHIQLRRASLLSVHEWRGCRSTPRVGGVSSAFWRADTDRST